MKGPQDQGDELQSIWQRNDAPESEKEIAMHMNLLQEKRRSLHDFVQGGSSNNYLLVLSFAPLFALGIWKTRHIALMQIGNLIVMVVLLAGALATWLYQRPERRLDQVDLNTRDFQRHLIHFINQSIAFSKGIKLWFAPVLFFGIALTAYPALNHFWSPALCIVALALLFVCFEYSVWTLCELPRVEELQRRKNDVESLLKEMDECR
jgi:hypothetical protein